MAAEKAGWKAENLVASRAARSVADLVSTMAVSLGDCSVVLKEVSRAGLLAVRWISGRDVHWDDSKAATWGGTRVAWRAALMALTTAENWVWNLAALWVDWMVDH